MPTMRIRSSGKFAYREDLYDDVGDRIGENTKSGAVDGTCEFTREMLGNLKRAVEHPDMTEELAEILSTSRVTVKYRVKTAITVD